MAAVIPMSKEEAKQVEEHILGKNHAEIGTYFRNLLEQGLGQWERITLFLFARSKGYQQNDAAKLLQLANDYLQVAEAKIKFVERYTGELFLPKAAEKEVEEAHFINSKIIPFLTHYTTKLKTRISN